MSRHRSESPERSRPRLNRASRLRWTGERRSNRRRLRELQSSRKGRLRGQSLQRSRRPRTGMVTKCKSRPALLATDPDGRRAAAGTEAEVARSRRSLMQRSGGHGRVERIVCGEGLSDGDLLVRFVAENTPASTLLSRSAQACWRAPIADAYLSGVVLGGRRAAGCGALPSLAFSSCRQSVCMVGARCAISST
jgi:hypothetical protein